MPRARRAHRGGAVSWHDAARTIGLVAAVSLPFFNIPLIIRIQRRKSSDDISLTWVIGAFTCMVLMLPSALISDDPVYRAYSAVNVVFFGTVVVQVLRFHKS